MTQDKDTKTQITKLAEVLDIYGANPSRWPAQERAGLEVLVKTQSQAQALLGEAQALEQVMASAPALRASDALKARILTAAASDSEREARVVPITAAPVRSGPSPRVQRATLIWPAAALAASFAFGLYLGVAGFGGQTFDGAFQIATINGSGGDADSISWLDDGTSSDAEDLL